MLGPADAAKPRETEGAGGVARATGRGVARAAVNAVDANAGCARHDTGGEKKRGDQTVNGERPATMVVADGRRVRESPHRLRGARAI